MRDKVVVALLCAFFVIVFITVAVGGLAVTGHLSLNPYTETVVCSVSGEATQAAIGDVFILRLDGQKTVKLQRSKCVNMDTAQVGDVFTAVVVIDANEELQCIVRVEY